MVYQQLDGMTVNLRPVEIKDAEFLLNLRRDGEKCKYLHNVDNDLEQEVQWIREQRLCPNDYFFVVEDTKNKAIGMIGFKVKSEEIGEVCRWVSYGDSIQNIETNLLICDFGFNVLGVKKFEGEIVAENKEMISLQKKFGYTVYENIYQRDGFNMRSASLVYEDYQAKRDRIIGIVERAIQIRSKNI